MKDYKRLTERRGNLVIDKCGNCENVKNPQGCTDKKCYEVIKNRLAELEDKIEQGLILELPCKVGDTIYRILPRCDNINKCSEFDQHICSRSNCDWHIRETKFALNMLNYIGDYYFTTKAEAEAHLQELRGGK